MELLIKKCEKIKNGYLIESEPNDIFYIDGKGGQLGDRGFIGTAQVLEVREEGIVVDRELKCEKYEIQLDFSRRKDIACQHTAQHTFSAIAYNDYNLNTVGFRMAEEYTTVDLDSNEIKEEVISDLERKVNEIITKALKIKIFTMENEEARKIEGLRKAIKDKVTGTVRFVEIPNVDLGACAGFHVDNTKDIKLFKIINYEKIKGNYTRFYFIAGDRALKDYSYKHRLSKDLCHIFSCKDYEILDMLDKTLQEKKKVESEYKNLASQYVELLAEKLLKESEILHNYQPIFYFGDTTVASFLSRYMKENSILVTGDNNSFSITAQNFDCKEFIKYLTENHNNIKGGGSKNKGNFKGEIKESELKNFLKNYLVSKQSN